MDRQAKVFPGSSPGTRIVVPGPNPRELGAEWKIHLEPSPAAELPGLPRGIAPKIVRKLTAYYISMSRLIGIPKLGTRYRCAPKSPIAIGYFSRCQASAHLGSYEPAAQ